MYCHKNIKTMLTLTDFRVMPFEKKCDVITVYQQLLIHRTLGDQKALYHAEHFNIEFSTPPKHAKVLMINAL